MKTFVALLVFLLTITIVLYQRSLSIFFAQDDFILLNQFSQNSFLENLRNAFGPPLVTHWRPVDNIFYLVTGSTFGKNYFAYHLFLLCILVLSGYFTYRIVLEKTTSKFSAFIAALIYTLHPAFYGSIAWISGGATLIGFLFALIAFNFLQKKRIFLSFIAAGLAFLASEAMVVSFMAFVFLQHVLERRFFGKKVLWGFAIFSVGFIFLKLFFLTPASAADTYRLQISPGILYAVKYYILRIIGFSDSSSERLPQILILAGLSLITYCAISSYKKEKNKPLYFLAFGCVVIGLVPFIFIPNHLSAYYLNLSIWGYSMLIAVAISKKKAVGLVGVIVLIIAFAINFKLSDSNYWVVKRAETSRYYTEKISAANLKKGTMIIFGDSNGRSSREAYFALGTGKGIDFWFGKGFYGYCFESVEKCSNYITDVARF